MNFPEFYQFVSDKFMKMDMTGIFSDFTVLIHVIDAGGFIFASWIGGEKHIAPVGMSSADITISASSEVFEKVINGSLDPFNAFTTGQITTTGNVMLALSLYNSLRGR